MSSVVSAAVLFRMRFNSAVDDVAGEIMEEEADDEPLLLPISDRRLLFPKRGFDAVEVSEDDEPPRLDDAPATPFLPVHVGTLIPLFACTAIMLLRNSSAA